MLNGSEEKTVLFHFSYQQNMLINSLQDYPTPSDVDFFWKQIHVLTLDWKKKFLNSENIDDFLIGIVYGKRTQN